MSCDHSSHFTEISKYAAKTLARHLAKKHGKDFQYRKCGNCQLFVIEEAR